MASGTSVSHRGTTPFTELIGEAVATVTDDCAKGRTKMEELIALLRSDEELPPRDRAELYLAVGFCAEGAGDQFIAAKAREQAADCMPPSGTHRRLV